MCLGTTWPETRSLLGLRNQPFRRFVPDDASSIPSLIVIHSHLLDGITASASSLPPFLPASDPRLYDALQGTRRTPGEGAFTSPPGGQELHLQRHSVIKGTMTSTAHPRYQRYRFERTDRTPKLHVTRLRRGLSSAIFQHLVPSKVRFETKTPHHVNTPLARLNKTHQKHKGSSKICQKKSLIFI